jgi:hypothetical protein
MINSELQKKIFRLKNNIPNWIDTKDVFHHKMWNTLLDVNNYIYFHLIVQDIISDEFLTDFINTIDDVLSPILGKDYDLEICVYYECLIEAFIKNLIKYEDYEAAENLKRFYNLYFRNDEEDLGYD